MALTSGQGNTVTIKVVATNASTDGNPAMRSDGWIVTDLCMPVDTTCLQWNPSNADTTGTTAVCPEYRGICIGIFPVGVALRTCAIELHSRALPCCALVRKASQRLVLCAPVLLQW